MSSQKHKDKSDAGHRKIFIGGLSYSTDDDKLRQYFQVYGAVQDAVVMKDPVSRRSRGFGFITYSDINSVENALAHEPHTIDSRKVEAKRAVPRIEGRDGSAPTATVTTPVSTPTKAPSQHTTHSTQSSTHSHPMSPDDRVPSSASALDPRINMEEYAYNKIFVGGLHYDTRDAEFRAYFEKFGKVLSAEVMFNRETHKSRGFGFIVFENERGADLVCAEAECVINGKVVEVKRAVPRSKLSPAAVPSPTRSKPLDKSHGHSSAPNIRSDVRRTNSVGSVVTGLPPRGTPVKVSQPSQSQQQQYSASLANTANTQRATVSYAAALATSNKLEGSPESSPQLKGLLSENKSRPSRAHSEPTIQVVSLDSLIDDYFDFSSGAYMGESFQHQERSAHNDLSNSRLYDRPPSFGSMGSTSGDTLGGGELSRHLSVGSANDGRQADLSRHSDLSRTSSFSSQYQTAQPGLIGSPQSKDNGSYSMYSAAPGFEDIPNRDRSLSGGLGFIPSYLSGGDEYGKESDMLGSTQQSVRAAPMTALMSLQQQHAFTQEKLRQQQLLQQQLLLQQQQQQQQLLLQQQLQQQQQQQQMLQQQRFAAPQVPSPTAWASFVAAPHSVPQPGYDFNYGLYQGDISSPTAPRSRGPGSYAEDLSMVKNLYLDGDDE